MNTLAHLTLNTGHLRMSPRSEVAEHAIRALDPIVLDTNPAGTVISGVRIRMQRRKNGASFTLGTEHHAMIVGALVWHEITAEHTWKSCLELYRGQHQAEPAAEMPSHIPWLAVQLPGAPELMACIATPEMWAQLGDLERCIAWTILAQEGLTA
jgi:hypothetical protein